MTKHELATQVIEAQNNKKYWAEQEKFLKDKLIKMSREKPWEDEAFKLARLERKGSIDYKALVAIENIDVEPYRKESICMWKLTQKVTLIS